MQNNNKQTIKLLIIGDVVGATGIALFQKHIGALKQKYKADGVIVNGENSAPSGKGITSKDMKALRHAGADLVTSGNHIWDQREIYNYFTEHTDLIRPANFPAGAPGMGHALFQCAGYKVAVMNLQGRVFMREDLDCPFRAADSLLTYLSHQTNIIIVDFHAEATSEKIGFGYYLDGRVSAVVGTHTHTQTADERILPKGTAYITDLGMVGALNGMLGMKKDAIINKFLTQMPTRFEVETHGPGVLSGICVEIDTASGKAVAVERVRLVDEQFVL